MDLYFLGTNAGVPTLQRNVTSVTLRLLEERRSIWMFDCGEGTQHQVLSSPIRLGKLEKLFITHLHGDHLFGLPGLLSSRGYQGGTAPLTVYGPPGLKAYLEISLAVSQSRIPYKIEIVEHTGGTIFEDDGFKVEAALLEHRIDSYGYRVTEKDSPGSLNTELLKSYGLKPGPIYGKLKKGEDVVTDEGVRICAADVVREPKRGRIVTILGDTRPCSGALELSLNADLVVHEATFAHDLADMAYQYHHSTARQAAELAKEAKAGQLLLTHFSSRYSSHEELIPLLEEAELIFPETLLAEEFNAYPVPRRLNGQ
ncbi:MULTISPECIES: ribonuclease Z [Paenibacillus]|uniref:Ribonuclease Z n=1 Tax=Paenibacillus odorifer TaxID=189426 RepID=A0A1R0WRK6_9BACL|nr:MULTISPECIES: ribonuclease Z [Paenibacillus]AIQ74802.1 ribonuclease Z [Paenibacillus odorifer]ETT46532.1 ribonuclease Z [Paenibacillus sp. FSL H8-237]OMD03344.1 ribonuclease Z [Paenibacillus odorifer]OMD17173.1 ribonuclease Z [Paenibacillus odorifer]OMD19836.1 ribonuclease Z [Paenibacillus odorifer]